MPDVKSTDEYHLDEGDAGGGVPNRPLALIMLWLNLVVLSASVGMIVTAFATIFDPDESHALRVFLGSSAVVLAVSSIALLLRAQAITPRSIRSYPHFSSATLAQFFYVAAQSGIFAYFINYMTSQAPVEISDKAASSLASIGFICFLVGRFTGAGLLGKFPAHRVLGLYAVLNVAACLLVVLKLGWVSVVCVFLSYFFMSIMFPTIFALGIHGLGTRAKKASAYIVMAIMGGAIVPKLMGHVADHWGMSQGFLVPMVCFAAVAAFGFLWKTLSQAEGPLNLAQARGH